MSSLPLDPLWVPFSAVKMAEEFLYFTMKLMTGELDKNSYRYFSLAKSITNYTKKYKDKEGVIRLPVNVR